MCLSGAAFAVLLLLTNWMLLCCCATMRCGMLCYAMLCYAMLCYAVLCCAVLCYAVMCASERDYAVMCRLHCGLWLAAKREVVAVAVAVATAGGPGRAHPLSMTLLPAPLGHPIPLGAPWTTRGKTFHYFLKKTCVLVCFCRNLALFRLRPGILYIKQVQSASWYCSSLFLLFCHTRVSCCHICVGYIQIWCELS